MLGHTVQHLELSTALQALVPHGVAHAALRGQASYRIECYQIPGSVASLRPYARHMCQAGFIL